VTTRALWGGRVIALLGIILLALSLRSAVSAISPIIAEIDRDIELTSVGVGIIGALPPVFFALAGLVAPRIAHKLGLELSISLAIALVVIGHLARGLAGSYAGLLIGSSVALAGMGVANVLLPPAVKRYFPDRIGTITAGYATLMSISTAIPALSSAPIADGYGWRVSLGIWSLTAAIALVPWIVLVARHRKAQLDDAPEVVEAPPALLNRMWRSRTAWSIAIAFAVSSINAYSMFAWLPRILVQTADVSHVAAGSLLALYSFVAVPASIIAPILVVRLRHPGWIIQAGVGFFVLGYGGLLLAPSAAPWLWVALIGLGPILFPVCLVLINLRTQSQLASAALSGFVQGVGYTLGALGPLLVGILHDLSGGWTVPILFLLGVGLVGIVSGLGLSKPRFVEQDLAQSEAAGS
jgi:CP family cyanate transporter-like MFS transporter